MAFTPSLLLPFEHAIIRPGVIFCLEQVRGEGDRDSNKAINPRHPYYLVYVRDDGEVRFGFAQPKQILDAYRLLCAGQKDAIESLCRLCDEETKDMTHYNRFIEAAVASLSKTYKARAASVLRQCGGILPSKQEQVDKTTDFNLITWLVVTPSQP